jgi:hypothetical protein
MKGGMMRRPDWGRSFEGRLAKLLKIAPRHECAAIDGEHQDSDAALRHEALTELLDLFGHGDV